MTLSTATTRSHNDCTIITLPRGTSEQRAMQVFNGLKDILGFVNPLVDFHPVDKFCSHIIGHPAKFGKGLFDLTPNLNWKGDVQISFINNIHTNTSKFVVELNGTVMHKSSVPAPYLYDSWYARVRGDMLEELGDVAILFLVGTDPSAEVLDRLQRGILQINHLPCSVFERYSEFVAELLTHGREQSGIEYSVVENEE